MEIHRRLAPLTIRSMLLGMCQADRREWAEQREREHGQLLLRGTYVLLDTVRGIFAKQPLGSDRYIYHGIMCFRLCRD